MEGCRAIENLGELGHTGPTVQSTLSMQSMVHANARGLGAFNCIDHS